MPLDNKRNLPETIGIYCLYVLFGALPLVFLYQSNDIFELAKLTVLRLTTLTMVGAWAAMCFRERRFIIARTPADYFILAYLGVFTLAAAFSSNILTSVFGEYGRFEGLLTIYNYAAVFFLAGIFIRENKLVSDRAEFIRGLMLTAVGTACLVSVYGIAQRFGWDFLAWSNNGVDTTRAFSTMGNPIYIAAYLTIMISIAIGLFVSEHAIRSQIALGAAITLMSATLVLTFSRAGWAGMIVAITVLIVLAVAGRPKQLARTGQSRMPHRSHSSTIAMTERSKKQRSRLPIFITLILAVVVFTGGVVMLSAGKASGPTKSALTRMASVLDFTGPAYADRVSMWKSSVVMIKNRPVLGYGPDMFGTAYPKYRRMDIVKFEREVNKLPRPRYQNRPHMDILQQGVSAGLLGMMAYIAMWGAFVWYGIKGVGSRESGVERYLGIGLIAGIIGFIFQIQFSFNTIAVTPLVWLGMALVFSIGDEKTRVQGSQRVQGVQSNQVTENRGSNVMRFGLLSVTFVILVTLVILSVCPIIADYYFDRALTDMAQGNTFGAQGNYDTAISFNPLEPAYSDYAGSAYVEQAKAATDSKLALEALLNAIRYEKLAIDLNPRVAGYRFNLGNAEYYYSFLEGLSEAESAANMQDAMVQFKFAAANDPLQPDFHFNLASAYIRFNNRAAAIKEIKAGLKIDPTRLDAKAWLATLTKGAGL